MTAPPTTKALDGGDEEPRLTGDEWAILEKYYRGQYGENWTQKDKVVLSSALQKSHGYLTDLPSAFMVKVRKWIEEGHGTKL
jgi:hypothetical protein